MQARPFHVHIPETELDDLHRRLTCTRWSPAPRGASWEYGIDDAKLHAFVDYWRDEFDWRTVEARINALPQFEVDIAEGVPLHFTHVRGKGRRVIPLIASHGWPWSFWDWHALIGPLTDPAAHGLSDAIAFDLVVPSLPGFGFSQPLEVRGITAPVVADLFDRLMRSVLGYERYCAAGGDWGAFVTWELGTRYADHVDGIYLSFPPIWHVGGVEGMASLDYAEDEHDWHATTLQRWQSALSHLTVHSHDHMTLAYALDDSPAGLAAWLLERRRNWADGDDLFAIFDKDFLATTVSIYWFSRTIGSSMQLYAEQFRAGSTSDTNYTAGALPRIEAPTAIGVYPGELVRMPRSACEKVANLVDWNILDRGGHFAPAENPGTYASELLRVFAGPLAPR
jgi:pimeloyl-ACP methyl ester carboxylesterase